MTWLYLQASAEKGKALVQPLQVVGALNWKLGEACDQIGGLTNQLAETEGKALDVIGALQWQVVQAEGIAGGWMNRAHMSEKIGLEALRQVERVDAVGVALGDYDWATQGVEIFEVCPLLLTSCIISPK